MRIAFMVTIVLAVLGLVAFNMLSLSGLVFAETNTAIYQYDDSNPPEVFFFPKEKARWDGTKVTIREWYMLTDLQKERFVYEYMGELKKNYDYALDSLRLDDYLRALNLFSYYVTGKASAETSTKVIDRLLKEQGIKK